MKNTYIRYLTAFIALPFLFAIIHFGSKYLFYFVICTVFLFALYEWLTCLKRFIDSIAVLPGLSCGLVAQGSLMVFEFTQDWKILYLGIFIILTGIATFMITLRNHEISMRALGSGGILFSVLVTAWAASGMIFIRSLQLPLDGRLMTYLFLGMVWSGDAGAMHVGKAFGQRKPLSGDFPKEDNRRLHRIHCRQPDYRLNSLLYLEATLCLWTYFCFWLQY